MEGTEAYSHLEMKKNPQIQTQQWILQSHCRVVILLLLKPYFTKQAGLSYMHILLNLFEPEFIHLYYEDNAYVIFI